jgi:hypothetical protein
VKPIVTPFDAARGGQVVIAIKKYYALMTLAESDYDYFVVVDSEVEVIPEYFTKENILSKINHIFSNKKVFGGTLDMEDAAAGCYINILKCSASVFRSPDDFRKLLTLTKGFTLYTVWGDIPVYERRSLKDFFEKIDVQRIEHRDYFDDVIYSNYLVLHQGFSFVNVTERIPHVRTSFEVMIGYTPEEMKVVKDLGFSFSWITGQGYDQHAEFLQEQKTYMKFHTDRKYNFWSFGIFTDGESNNEYHDLIVESIRKTSVLKNSEIIFITENRKFSRKEKVLYIDINSAKASERNSIKKNFFAKNAMHENLCILHDYIVLDENFGKGFDEDWDVCSIPLVLPDGKRWWDWRVHNHPVFGHTLSSYDCPATEWHFVTGNLFMVKKEFLLENPMPETDEGWENPGSEDYEWTKSVRSFWKYKLNKNTIAKSLKYKHIDPIHYSKIDV